MPPPGMQGMQGMPPPGMPGMMQRGNIGFIVSFLSLSLSLSLSLT
jgi:hypothetical protein